MFEATRFSSVSDLVRESASGPDCADEFTRLSAKRAIIGRLMALRAAKGMSQADIAKSLGCSQSRISKMEAGNDEDIRLGDLAAYAGTMGYTINMLLLDRSEPLVGQVKYHAILIGKTLERLVKLAHIDEGIAQGVTGFFGEAFFNLLNIFKKTSDGMPTNPDGSKMIEIDIIGPLPIESEDSVNGKGRRSRQKQVASA